MYRKKGYVLLGSFALTTFFFPFGDAFFFGAGLFGAGFFVAAVTFFLVVVFFVVVGLEAAALKAKEVAKDRMQVDVVRGKATSRDRIFEFVLAAIRETPWKVARVINADPFNEVLKKGIIIVSMRSCFYCGREQEMWFNFRIAKNDREAGTNFGQTIKHRTHIYGRPFKFCLSIHFIVISSV